MATSKTTKEKTETTEEKPEFVGRILHYTGPTQHTRVISKDDFKAAGFTGMSDLTFGPHNRHQIQETEDKQFSDELLTFLVDEVQEFEVKEPKAGVVSKDDQPTRSDVAGYTQGTVEDPAADTVGGNGTPVAPGGSSTAGAGSSTAGGGTVGNGSST